MTISLAVQLERDNALDDAKEIIDTYGEDIILDRRYEETDPENVHRDSYNSLKRHRTDIADVQKEIKAYPVIFNPNAKEIDRAGLKEDCEVLLYTAMHDWDDLNIDFEDLDIIRDTIKLRDIKYVIKEKALVNQFADTFLNISFGLERL